MFQCIVCSQNLDHSDFTCSRCGTTYPVVGGIPRFTDFQDDGFDKRWQQHPKPQATTEPVFWEKTGWSSSDLRGKTILDAGVGCGRFAQIAACHGAQVYGVDLSPHGLEAASKLVPSGTMIQANLLDLPIEDASFDMAYSIGVLHHTGDTKAAFMELARTVKPGGWLAVWVYSKPVPNDDLLPVSEFLHEITKSCPPEALHAACEKYSVRVRDIYMRYKEWAILKQILQVSHSPDNEECISDTFDWHTPQFRDWHTSSELRSWFAEAGYVVDREGKFPVSVRGVRK